jgi:hypothetical protein
MHTGHRPRGRAPAAILSLCLGMASACSDEPAPQRGQRVFLTVDVRSSFFFGVNFFAALIDDIQIR